MAKQLSDVADDEGQGTTKGHNAAARAEALRYAVKRWGELDEQKKALSREQADLKKSLKDYNVAPREFDTLRRLYEMDAMDRDELLDFLREGFAALDIGHQLDWIHAAAKAGAA